MEVEGLNHARIINSLLNKGVCVSKIKSKKNAVKFAVLQKDLEFTLNYLKETERNFKIIKNAGLLSVFPKLLKRKGLIVGVVISFLAITVLSNFILGINISAESEDVNYIKNLLIENKIGVFSLKNKVDKEKLRLSILNGIDDLSFVEIEQNGAFLNISLINELDPPDIIADNKTPITSLMDAVVTRIVVLAGTSLVKVNEPVKAGEILIAPYVKKGEEEEESAAKGYIYGRVWRKKRVVFMPYSMERVRTGKVEKNSTVSAFSISTKPKPCKFELYETEKKTFVLTALFPLVIVKETRYELKDVKIAHNFSDEKDMLINKAFDELRLSVKKDAVECDNYYVIKELDNCILIDVYLETEEIISNGL